MAGHHLIDAYLETLADQLRWRGDHADVDSELRDHLYCAAEHLEARGIDADDAQRQVLLKFGDPTVVTAAFATTGSRGLALPTQFTTRAGRLAHVATAGWLVLGVGWNFMHYFDANQGWSAPTQASYIVAWVGLLIAAGVTVVVLAALDRRHGGLGILGRAGAIIAGLGVVASVLGWLIAGWGSLIGIGCLLVAIAVLKRDIAPRLPMLLMAASWLVAVPLFGLLEFTGAGSPDQWGDHPLASLIAVSIGAVGMAIGVTGVGRWLASEQPVNPELIESAAGPEDDRLALPG